MRMSDATLMELRMSATWHVRRTLVVLPFVGLLLFLTPEPSTGFRSRDASTLRPGDSLQVETVQVLVDPRVELLSIICLLAGYSEYGTRTPSAYVDDIHDYFQGHADHKAVRTARELWSSRGFCCDAPAVLAAHMRDPLQPTSEDAMDLLPATFEKRWSRRRLHALANEACDFSRTADFQSFVRRHEEMYGGMVTALKDTLERHAHLEWLPTFFGVHPGPDVIVVPTVLTQGNHYAAWVEANDGRARLHCVLGFQVGESDEPICPDDPVPLVVHELCHFYVNSIVDRHSSVLEAACERVAPGVGEVFRRNYGAKWKTMACESLVRACTRRYVDAHDSLGAAARLIETDKWLGLPWVGELSNLLGKYEDQRNVFPTLDDYVPEIAAFFREYDLSRLRSSTEPTAR